MFVSQKDFLDFWEFSNILKNVLNLQNFEILRRFLSI